MGTYHEPRVPQGAPSDGERDVWLADGKVKFGHYVAASSSWVVDREEAYDGGVEMADSWHVVGAAGEPAFSTNGWSQAGGGDLLKFKKVNGICHLTGISAGNNVNSSGYVFILPDGYRPEYELWVHGVLWFDASASTVTVVKAKIYTSGQVDSCCACGVGDSLTFPNLSFPV